MDSTSAAPKLPTTRANLWAFWTVVIFSLLFANAPIVSWFLQPVTQFTTLVHELGHAVACIITGGHVSGLTIVSDGAGHGGLTNCSGGSPFIYAQAGYLGTALFGSVLIFLCQFKKLANKLLIMLGIGFGLATVFLVGGNVFSTGFQGVMSFLWGIAMSASLVWAGIKWHPEAANLLVLFLAVQTALDSVTSIVTLVQASLFSGTGTWSDATNMQMMTGIPAAIWALGWVVTSIALVAFTIWRTYGYSAKKKTLN